MTSTTTKKAAPRRKTTPAKVPAPVTEITQAIPKPVAAEQLVLEPQTVEQPELAKEGPWTFTAQTWSGVLLAAHRNERARAEIIASVTRFLEWCAGQCSHSFDVSVSMTVPGPETPEMVAINVTLTNLNDAAAFKLRWL